MTNHDYYKGDDDGYDNRNEDRNDDDNAASELSLTRSDSFRIQTTLNCRSTDDHRRISGIGRDDNDDDS